MNESKQFCQKSIEILERALKNTPDDPILSKRLDGFRKWAKKILKGYK